MDYSFRPTVTGRGGAQIVHVPVALGTITANTTTTFAVPKFYNKVYVLGASYQTATVAADADGAITGVLQKYRAASDDAVAISSAFDLETAVASEAAPLTVNGGDVARTAQAGDTFRFVVTNDSAAINTQHALAFLVLELAVLK